jgi:ATP-dependent RNA helicase UAP56/SUB2
VFFGGLPVRENTDILKDEKPNIVIGTPGRILSLVKSHSLDLKNIKLFICDEVDQLIGCEAMHRGVQAIFAAMPQNKQVLLFSATLPKELRPLCKRFTHNVSNF